MKKIILPAILSFLFLLSFSSPALGADKAYSRAAFNPNPDKKNFLVVWQDQRPYSSSDMYSCYYGCDAAIWGAFLNTNLGKGADFPIANTQWHNEIYPEIAYNSQKNEYLVVYMRCDGPCSRAADGDWNIYATRVAGDGSILGTYEVNIEADRQYEPTVAYDEINNQYLVAFMGLFVGGADKDIKIQLLSAEGIKIGPPRFISIDEDGNNFPLLQERPDVVFIPEKSIYFLAWEDHHNWSVAGTVLDTNGNFLITPKNFFLGEGTGDKYYPQLSYNQFSQEIWVTWQNSKADRKTVEAQRVSLTGEPIGNTIIVDDNAAPLVDRYGQPMDYNPRPGIACDSFNGSCLITWMNNTGGENWGFQGQFFGQTGKPIAEKPALGGNYGDRSTVVFNFLEKYFLVLKTQVQERFPPNKIAALPEFGCLKEVLGNLNCDSEGKINEADLTLLLGDWGGTQYNFTGSLTTGQVDLNKLLLNWIN